MYFYTQFSHTTSQRFSAANENGANLSHNDIYTNLLQEFYDKYELPALHHEGDGFSQGDASDEEMDTVFERIKEVHLSDYSNEISSMGREEVSNEEILEFLDKEFMSIEETAYDAALEVEETEGFAKFLIACLVEDSSLQNQYSSYYTIFSEVSEGMQHEWSAEGNEGEPTRDFTIKSILNTDWEAQVECKGWDWEEISTEMVEFGYN